MLGTSCCHLFLCPRRPTFGQEGCCSKQLLPWWSAPAVHAPELKGARRCNSDISSAFPSSISWYAHLTKVSFLSVCVNNYRYSYSYDCCCLANAAAKKCSSLLKGFFVCDGESVLILKFLFQKSFANLPMAFTDELDWPQFSEITGFLNSTIG